MDTEVLSVAIRGADEPEEYLRFKDDRLIFEGRVTALQKGEYVDEVGSSITLIFARRRYR